MTRRKTFDPAAVPANFWRRDDVRLALARREIGRLFGIYLDSFTDCTQAQLALLTEHDRSDISNFVRGIRSPRVTDIDVLGRIADGMGMPDEVRVMLGLAPANVTLSAIQARSEPPPERDRLQTVIVTEPPASVRPECSPDRHLRKPRGRLRQCGD